MTIKSKLNCEVLQDDLAFEVRWAVAGDSIVLQLVAKIDGQEYMSFGLSGEDNRSAMVKGDVVVAYIDKDTSKGYAEDYYLDAKSQCSGPSGSCPDTKLADNTNNVRLLNAAMVNGYSIVTYQRSLRAADTFDKSILTNQSQPIIWAIGPLNQRNEVSFHSHYTKGDKFIEFGRPPKWNCPMPETEQPHMKAPIPETTQQPAEVTTPAPVRGRSNSERRRGQTTRQRIVQDQNDAVEAENRTTVGSRGRQRVRVSNRQAVNSPKAIPTPAPASKKNAWVIPPIPCDEPEDGVFYAQMGPTGGKHGYPAITGHVGWGISWYINGLLIPVINVVRGKSYNFVVEAGSDPEIPAKYHPLYITDDPIGGYAHKTAEEKQSVKIFGGAERDENGEYQPLAAGRWCSWQEQGDIDADDFESFGGYQRHLQLKCDEGDPDLFRWTPDHNTPDTVYYQCFTHRYLGWKINVLDSCPDKQQSGSETVETIVLPPNKLEQIEDSPIQTEEKVVTTPYNIPLHKFNISNVSVAVKNLPQAQSKSLQDEAPFHSFSYAPSQYPLGYNSRYLVKTPHFLTPVALKGEKLTPKAKLIARPIYIKRIPQKILPQKQVASNIMYAYLPLKKNNPLGKKVVNFVVFTPESVTKAPLISSLVTKEPKNEVKHVEISAQQPSTEKPPLVQKQPLAQNHPLTQKHSLTQQHPLIQKHPLTQSHPLTQKHPLTKKQPLTIPKNYGFNPDSIQIETGFTPMQKSKKITNRIDFSPPDLQPQESKTIPYYLPPLNSQKPPQHIQNPSNIDFAPLNDQPPLERPNQPLERLNTPSFSSRMAEEVAPDVVVTYDGKKLSGHSLTIKQNDRSNVFDARSSKRGEFIRARPQYALFMGELPPLGDLTFNVPQGQRQGVLHRDLDAPDLETTRLTRVGSFRG